MQPKRCIFLACASLFITAVQGVDNNSTSFPSLEINETRAPDTLIKEKKEVGLGIALKLVYLDGRRKEVCFKINTIAPDATLSRRHRVFGSFTETKGERPVWGALCISKEYYNKHKTIFETAHNKELCSIDKALLVNKN